MATLVQQVDRISCEESGGLPTFVTFRNLLLEQGLDLELLLIVRTTDNKRFAGSWQACSAVQSIRAITHLTFAIKHPPPPRRAQTQSIEAKNSDVEPMKEHNTNPNMVCAWCVAVNLFKRGGTGPPTRGYGLVVARAAWMTSWNFTTRPAE